VGRPFPNAPAFIAQLMAASALYVVTSLIFLDNELTMSAPDEFEIVFQVRNGLFLAPPPMLLAHALGAELFKAYTACT